MNNVKCILLISLCITLVSGIALGDDTGISKSLTPDLDAAPGTTEVVTRDDNCNLITFEGLADNAPIGLVPGDVNVTFGTSWLSLIDGDDGGSGNFANEPSSFTAAYFLDTNDISISLSPAVQFLEFWYVASAASLPLTVTAYDAAGNVVDTVQGNTLGTSFDGANCVGDPNGDFCLWDVVTFNSTSDNIASIEILGATANQFGFDNLNFCVQEQELVGCCLPDYSCAMVTEQGCEAAGGVVTGMDCEGVDCQTVDTDIEYWDNLKARYR